MTIVGVVAIAGWLFWTLSNPEPCERVRRGVAPVRMAFDMVRWTGENWLDSADRIKMVMWSIEADVSTQGFVKHHFYGDQLQCGPNGKPAPTPVVVEKTRSTS